MAVEEGTVLAGRTDRNLDTTKVRQVSNAEAHRQVMVIGDPETLARRASVTRFGNHDALVVSSAPHAEDFFIGLGEKDISGAANNIDIWGGPTSVQPEPDTDGYSLFIVSSSPNDTLLGTGAQIIDVHYLDTLGAQQDIVVNMNGQTEIDTGVTDCMFVQDIYVISVGDNLVSVGNIDALSGSGGTVVQRVEATGNRSMSTMKQVPAGKVLILTGWFAVGVASTVKIGNIRLRSTTHEGISVPGVYQFLSNCRVKDFAGPFIPITYDIPAFATVKISAWTDGTIGISAQWNGYLEDVE